mmetsp:Transcript_52444/g.125308  ORF Transcript_52444/g.125308 Transcript_52444/m.125308 type:complete len:1031 (-) Transcript_52444:115-3207(-)
MREAVLPLFLPLLLLSPLLFLAADGRPEHKGLQLEDVTAESEAEAGACRPDKLGRQSLLSLKYVLEESSTLLQQEQPIPAAAVATSSEANATMTLTSKKPVEEGSGGKGIAVSQLSSSSEAKRQLPDVVNMNITDKVAEIPISTSTPWDVATGLKDLIVKIGRLAHRTASDAHATFVRFFPGLHFKKSVLMDLALTTSLTCLWFFYYLRSIYSTDRTELSHSWSDYQEEAQKFKQQHQQNGHITLDLVIALPNPGKKHSGGSDLISDAVSINTLSAIFPRLSLLQGDPNESESQEQQQWFDKVREQVASECPPPPPPPGAGSASRRRGSITYTGLAEGAEAMKGLVATTGTKSLNKDILRVNLLQDLCNFLPGIGFDVTTFLSSSGQEIFLGVTMSRGEAIKHYLDRDNISLQLQEGIAARLGIQQPDDAMSSPPKLKYDPRAEERLWQAGIIPKKSAAELYMHTSPGQQGDMSVISGKERFSVIYKEISQYIALELARTENLLQDFYAVHDQFQLMVLRRTWSNFFSLNLVQPVNLLEMYFGSSIAFRAAWVGMYVKGLIALLPVAFCYVLVDTLLEKYSTTRGDNVVDERAGELEAKHLLGFSLVLIIWARVLFNLWTREEKFFGSAWEVHDDGDLGAANAYFRGSYKPSQIDSKVQERQYSPVKALLWRYLSWSVVALMCFLVVAAIYIQKEIVENQVPMALSVVVTAQINIFEFLFNRLAMTLTNWENHRRRVGHKNSYLLKQAIFQSVNNFYPFIYLIVKQANTTTNCPGGACLTVVREQLRSALVLLSLSRIVLFGALYVWVQFSRWQMQRRLTKRAKEASGESAGGAVPYVEEQIVYMPFDTAEETWAMLESIISLGHTLLFGAIVREAIPLSLGVFFLSRHSTAFVLTRFSQRPFPAGSDGIGAWQIVIGLIMKAGVLSNTFCIVAFGESFRGVPTAARVSGFISIAALLFTAIGIVDLIFAPADKDVKLLEARRRHVKQGVNHAGRKLGEQGTPRFTAECSSARAIQEGHWDLIPPWFALS